MVLISSIVLADNSILSEANSYLQNACYLLKQQEDKFSAAHSDLVDEELLGSMQALPGTEQQCQDRGKLEQKLFLC